MEEPKTIDLIKVLRKKIQGEVRQNLVDRTLYSTDASNYRIIPQAVVIPENQEDLAVTIYEASCQDVSVTVRGAGTSLAGQAVGAGIIVDLSKRMNKVIEVDADGRKAKVEPGITIDELNRKLSCFDLMFGPDPSSSSVATIGGAIANNATGAHSILYGMSGDHVISSNVVLADGTVFNLSEESYRNMAKGDGIANNLFEKLSTLMGKSREIIKRDFPKHWRRASGYSLDCFLHKNFNPAKLLASSEGTLAVSADFEINLVKKPHATTICVIKFREIPEAMEAVPEILTYKPSAVELIDGNLISLAGKKQGFLRLLSFLQDIPNAVLVVEFQGENKDQAKQKLNSFITSLVFRENIFALIEEQEQQDLWAVRKAGLGLLMSARGRHKPVPCIEDVSVPVENLADYTKDLIRLLAEFNLKAAFYGHASAGCLHVRPLIDLGAETGVISMIRLAERTLDLVLRHSGVMSGEHGDGLQRSHLNQRLFGEDLYSVMKELKSLFDPKETLNPKKVVNGEEPSENLRIRKSIESFPVFLDWSREGGLAAAAAMCNGQGVCRKTAGGIMCPSYRATLDERDTTRARANLLREVLCGNMRVDAVYEKEFYDVFDLCIGCKACRTECPSGVDVGKMKTEFLAHYKRKKGFTARDLLFGRVHEISSMRSALPRFFNKALESSFTRNLLLLAGVDNRRKLPQIAEKTFSNWFSERKSVMGKKQVVYFHDTWSEFFYPEVGKASTLALESLGYEVIIENRRKCCGRPMFSTGMVEKARENADHNINILSDYAKRNIPVIFSEPSCISAFRDEYSDLIPENSALETVLLNIHSICEFLSEQSSTNKISQKDRGEILLHGHCHERASGEFEKTVSLFKNLGYHVQPSGAGCCGMAGSFGYEKEHYNISKAIGECELFPKIRNLAGRERVCVTGVSCLEQVSHFTDVSPVHVALLIRESLAD